jgi:hypothetical protein
MPGGHTPRLIFLTPSGNHLLIACAEWTVYHLAVKAVKPVLVLSLTNVKKRPLDSPLMTFMGAFPDTNRVPVLFITNKLKDSIRSVYLAAVVSDEKVTEAQPPAGKGAAPAAGKGLSKSGKELEPGNKLPLEKGKGAVALASHPFAPILYVLTVNGELQLFQHIQGAATLQPLFQFTSSPRPAASPLCATRRCACSSCHTRADAAIDVW